MSKKNILNFGDYIRDKTKLVVKENRSKSLTSLKNIATKTLPSFIIDSSINEPALS